MQNFASRQQAVLQQRALHAAHPLYVHGTGGGARAPTTAHSSSRHVACKSLDDNGWAELTPESSGSSSGTQTKRSQGKPPRPSSTTRAAREGRPRDTSNSSSSSSSRDKGAGHSPGGWYDPDADRAAGDSSWYSDGSSNSSRAGRSDSSSSRGAAPSRSSREAPPAYQQQDSSRSRQPSRHNERTVGAAGIAEPRAARPTLFRDTPDSSSNSPHRDSSSSSSRAAPDHPDALPGDWVCSECGDLNFARRLECRSCEAPRPPRPSSSSSTFTPQPGDWTCPTCSDVNFAWRTECRSCQEPRPKAAAAAAAAAVRAYRGSSSSEGAGAGQGRDKKVKKKKASSLVDKGVACCYGCGAPLQTQVPAAAGYVDPVRFEAKKKHRQLQQVLCGRCNSLAHGAMIPAVKDFTQKAWLEEQRQLLEHKQSQEQQQQQAAAVPAAAAAAAAGDGADREPLELLGKVLVTAEELRDKIAEVSSVKALVVMLVDLLDVSGTLMGKVRDMVGNNPIVLVGTKMDLLPAGCSPKEVADWLTEAAGRRRLQVTSTHLISSRSGEGVAAVASKVARERKGRDVFVVGAANVGKSAFVRALLREMSSLTGGNFDAAAASTSRYLPVESAMPGTTLGIIPLQAFETGGTLYDTPGVHLHHRVPHMLAPDELRLLHPRRRLAPFTPPSPAAILQEQEGEDEEGEEGSAAAAAAAGSSWKDRAPAGSSSSSSRSSSKKPQQVSASYLWSGLVRVDVLSGPPSISLVFYGPKTLRVAALPLLAEGQQVDLDFDEEAADSDGDDDDAPADDKEQQHTNSSSSNSKRQRVLLCKESVEARGGLVPHLLRVPVPTIPSSACLADIAVSGLPGWVSLYAPYARQGLVLRVWVPRGVEVFLRPPLPCAPPPRPGVEGAEGDEGGVGGAELADIGAALDVSEGRLDADWELHREELGLRPLSAEDEEVIKMLLYGNEAAGVTGIMDLEDEELQEGEEYGADSDSDGDAAEAASDSGGSDIAGGVARALQAETLAATVADALAPGRRSKVGGTRSSGGRSSGVQGLTIVEEEEAEGVPGAPAATRRRRRQR